MDHPDPAHPTGPTEGTEPTVPPAGPGPDPADDPTVAAGAGPGAAGGRTREGGPVLSRGGLTLLVAPIIVLVVINNIGNALFPTLSTQNPLLLIAMTPAIRNLVIAASQVDFWAYFPVGFVRLLAPDPFFYLLGFYYGGQAVDWMEHRTKTVGTLMRQLEELFGRYGHVLVLIMPNNPICLLAGAARMRPRVFWALNVVGTIGRLLLMAWIGQQFQSAIDTLLEWITAYRTPLLVVTVTLVGVTTFRELRTGTSEIQSLLSLEEELEADAAGATGSAEGGAGPAAEGDTTSR